MFSDSDFFRPLRERQEYVYFCEYWHDKCEQVLWEEGYTNEEIIDMQDLIVDCVDDSWYDSDATAIKILQKILENYENENI